jgi:actin-related protein
MQFEADVRERLLSNIVLCGGGSQSPGFSLRLENEIAMFATVDPSQSDPSPSDPSLSV